MGPGGQFKGRQFIAELGGTLVFPVPDNLTRSLGLLSFHFLSSVLFLIPTNQLPMRRIAHGCRSTIAYRPVSD